MTEIPRLWDGETVVCIGTGPSLTQADVDLCRGRAKVIVVNDAYKLAPWADVLYFCDVKWVRWHPDARNFAGLKYTMTAASIPGVQMLRNLGETGLSLDPTGLRTGYNSGYQAINLATLLGAKRIILLGYDMQGDHAFGSHPDKSRPPFPKCIPAFSTLVQPLADAGVEIVNCSRQTALTCFQRADLISTLPSLSVKERGKLIVLDPDYADVSVTSPVTPVDVPVQSQIAVVLQTCGRLEYTRRTLESFTAQHPYSDWSRFVLFHADDGSTESDLLPLVHRHGFETIIRHTTRQGARKTRREIGQAVADRGISWLLLLENDWEWVRAFPFPLFDYLTSTRPDVYSLRLYGTHKGRNRTIPCRTTSMGLPARAPVPWWRVPGAPEPCEIGRMHWGAPPAVTRTAEFVKIHEWTKGKTETADGPEMAASGRLPGYVARVLSNAVYHIGTERTKQIAKPKPVIARRFAPVTVTRVVPRGTAKPKLYTPAWQETRKWTGTGSSACLELALAALGKPTGLLDVGCGDGHLVREATAKGVPSLGVDLSIEGSTGGLRPADLREPLDLQQTFGLVLCWEVAEHLPASAADTLCDSLVRHLGPDGVLLFTAAVPGQGGQGHINCQPPMYWRDRLLARGLSYDGDFSRRLGAQWRVAAPSTPWYGRNLQVFRRREIQTRPSPPRIAFTMRTADRSPHPNYVGDTVRRFLSQGSGAPLHLCATAPEIGWLEKELHGTPAGVTWHVPDTRKTPNENGLAQIACLEPHAYDWVVLLEDDLKFCQDFVGSVTRWIQDHARRDRHFYRLFGFRVQPTSQGRAKGAYDVSLDRCAGSQVVVLRMADALDFVAWSRVNLERWGGFRGNSRIAFDKLLAAWVVARWGKKHPGVMSCPMFVKHVGKISSLHPATAHMDAHYGGDAWQYGAST